MSRDRNWQKNQTTSGYDVISVFTENSAITEMTRRARHRIDLVTVYDRKYCRVTEAGKTIKLLPVMTFFRYLPKIAQLPKWQDRHVIELIWRRILTGNNVAWPKLAKQSNYFRLWRHFGIYWNSALTEMTRTAPDIVDFPTVSGGHCQQYFKESDMHKWDTCLLFAEGLTSPWRR